MKRLNLQYLAISSKNTWNWKRLDLLFGNTYNLDIIDNEDTFTVKLSVPI